VLLFRYYPFDFLGSTPEVIIQARGLVDQVILIKWKVLNSVRDAKPAKPLRPKGHICSTELKGSEILQL
jgi:hypothetical protein